MRAIKILYIILSLFVIAPIVSYAQVEEEILESNFEYKKLKAQLDSLQSEQAAFVEEINKYKELSERDPDNKDEYISKVLRMEGQLFDLRSRIGILNSKCSAIEQEFIIKNLHKKSTSTYRTTSTSKQASNTSLLLNKFFIDNLSPEEMKIMHSEVDLDSIMTVLRDSLRREVEVLRVVNDKLRRTQDAEVADSLFLVADSSFKVVDRCEKTLKRVWNDSFDTKVYVYTRLLDKLNVSASVLSKLGEKMRDVKSAKEAAQTAKFSPDFFAYPLEHELVLEYEKILAEKLGYLSSIDSLSRKVAVIKTRHFDEDIIDLPDWDYVNFVNVKVGGSGVHNAKNPVKDVQIPTLGSVYMLRVMILSNPISQISTLKNINPVSMFRNESGKYEYYAGLYNSREAAAEDFLLLRKIGVSPQIVEWKNGGKVFDETTIIPLDVADNSYRIDFETITPEITAKLKELAPGKELLRIDDKYSIGFFKNYLDAVKIKKAIGVECEIVPIETK